MKLEQLTNDPVFSDIFAQIALLFIWLEKLQN